MGGSSDAFALYLSLFQVDRPTDTSKPSTSLAYHKDAEAKFEYGTGTLKKTEAPLPQTELMSHADMKAKLDAETKPVDLPTEHVPANPTARGGRTLGGGEEGQAAGEELTVGQRRQMAVRAAEKRQAEQVKGIAAGEVRELPARAQPAA